MVWGFCWSVVNRSSIGDKVGDRLMVWGLFWSVVNSSSMGDKVGEMLGWAWLIVGLW